MEQENAAHSISRETRRLRAALEVGTEHTAFWRGIRNSEDDLVDLLLIEANESFASWLGRPLDDIRGRRYSEVQPNGVLERLPVYLNALSTSTARQVTFDFETPDGTARTYESRVAPCGDDELFVAVWDVDERTQTIRELEAARIRAIDVETTLDTALNRMTECVTVVESFRLEGGKIDDIRVLLANDASVQLAGMHPGQVVGWDIVDLFPDVHESGLWDALVHSIDSMIPGRISTTIKSNGGWTATFDTTIWPFGSGRAIVIAREIAEGAVPYQQPVALLRQHDPLTSLPNRNEFRRLLANRIANLEQDEHLTLVSLDIDQFGAFNDLIGIRAADDVLVEIALRIRTFMAGVECPSRVGPDEFSFLLPMSLTSLDTEELNQRLQSMLYSIGQRHTWKRLSASIGVCGACSEDDVDNVLTDCEAALRYATLCGGRQTRVYADSLRRELLVGEVAAQEILSGLQNREFFLEFQPIFRTNDQTRFGYESLVRWNNPRLGRLNPAAFISTAESTRTIEALGGWVLETSMAQTSHIPNDTITINVSVLQLFDDTFMSRIHSAVERSGRPAKSVVLEVTESEMFDDSIRLRTLLTDICSMGIGIAIDDFGSGYSSIRYLHRLPVDIVKLDAGLIQGTMTRARGDLLRASVDMIRAIDAVSLIEGVETQEQFDIALNSGIELVQGYLFGRPGRLPAA